MSIYQDGESKHPRSAPVREYEHPSDEKRRHAYANGEHLPARPAKCKSRGCDRPQEWTHEDGSKLCAECSRIVHAEEIEHAYDTAEEWRTDERIEREREWDGGPR